MQLTHQSPMYRFGVAGSIALPVASLLFLLMHSLIQVQQEPLIDIDTPGIIPFVRLQDDDVQPPKTIRHTPLREAEEPPPLPEPSPFAASSLMGSGLWIAEPVIELPDAGIFAPGVSNELLPIVKIAPEYPHQAGKLGLEGYAIVEFTVTVTGTTRDIRVVEANPPGVFNQAAIKAVSRFKYQPRRVNGVPVAVTGVQNRFIFRFSDE